MTLLELTRVKKIQYTSILFISIPLVLSAFTHLWNPVGFPGIHYDEGIYMRRALHVLEGQGPQEPGRFDHPYFGQLFLAGVFQLLGYPDSIKASGNIHFIEDLYMVPRLLMGLLAVVDTFLIYKISQYRYNRNVALIASILFAVMPLSWLTRRIYLDSIQLPFLLSSILFAVYPYYKKSNDNLTKNINYVHQFGKVTSSAKNYTTNNKKNVLVILLSGIFMGIAIFTKIPAFTMIPMVGLLVYMSNRNSNVDRGFNKVQNQSKSKTFVSLLPHRLLHLTKNKSLILLGLWFIPVILIPAIWPAYSILNNQFDDWKDGVLWQATQRPYKGIFDSINSIYIIDPVLVILGLSGFIFAAVRRDIALLLWIVPFVLFFTFIEGYVNWFHWIPIIPGFCIAAAKLIADISRRIIRNIKVEQIAVYTIVAEIGIFGMVSTGILLSTNVASFQLNASAFVAHTLIQYEMTNANGIKDNDITIVSSPMYSWIFKYVLDKNNTFSGYNEIRPLPTQKVLLMVDKLFSDYLQQESGNKRKAAAIDRLQNVYDQSHKIGEFKGTSNSYNRDEYPYASMKYNYNGGKIQVRTNY